MKNNHNTTVENSLSEIMLQTFGFLIQLQVPSFTKQLEQTSIKSMRQIYIDYEKLNEIVNKQRDKPTKYFFGSECLTKYQTLFTDDGKQIRSNGNALDGLYIYVVTPGPNSIEYSILAADANEIGIHHSAFTDGGPVIAAGTKYIQDGVEKWCDNNSGHYAMSNEEIYEGIQHRLMQLNKLGEDKIKDLIFYDYTNHPDNQEIDVYLLEDFISAKGNPEILPNYKKATYHVKDTNNLDDYDNKGKTNWTFVSGKNGDKYFPFSSANKDIPKNLIARFGKEKEFKLRNPSSLRKSTDSAFSEYFITQQNKKPQESEVVKNIAQENENSNQNNYIYKIC